MTRSHDELIENEARRIASIVSTQVENDRAVYTSEVVAKLNKDGKGAHRDFATKEGFIPLPAQFVREVSQRVGAQSSHLYNYALVSRWNLNPERGLTTEFDRWAWAKLSEQDKGFSGQLAPKEGYPWQPVSRIEEVGGSSVLRFMSADAASAPACVTCHNNFEGQDDIKALRRSAGVEEGKEWKQHQLMGALRVDVPLDNVKQLASAGRQRLLWAVVGVLALALLALLVLVHITVVRPVELSIREVKAFTKQVDDVVACVRELHQGAEQHVAMFEQETNVPEGLKPTVQKAMENASRAEIAASHCARLESGFKVLRERMAKMVGG